MTDSERPERGEFEALVRAHQAQVCAVAYSVLRDRARSEEVAQDAFLVAWRERHRTEPNVRWLCGIARNLARNASRRRKEVPMTEDSATERLSSTRTARDELISREEAARAEAALGELPARYRDAVVLYYGGDESIAEVAAALGISPDSARQRVHRGRERLRSLLSSVETTLRAARPTTAFTVACVAAWVAGKAAPANAAALPKSPLVPAVGVGVLALAAAVTLVVANAHGPDRRSSSTRQGADTGELTASAMVEARDPRSALQRRFPMRSGHVEPERLPIGTFALAPSEGTSGALRGKTMELDFSDAPLHDLMALIRNVTDTPIWVAYDARALVTIRTGGEKPALDVLDQVLDLANATRDEVPALQIIPGGRTDAATLGGEHISVSFRAIPLNLVLDALEPKLGMPIGRLGTEVLRGQTDENGAPLAELSPPVTLDLHDVPAGVALEQALVQAGVGYELTTGFVILPR